MPIVKNPEDLKALLSVLKRLKGNVDMKVVKEHPPIKSMTKVLMEIREAVAKQIAFLQDVLAQIEPMVEETKKWTELEHRAYMRSVEMERKLSDLRKQNNARVDEDGDDTNHNPDTVN